MARMRNCTIERRGAEIETGLASERGVRGGGAVEVHCRGMRCIRLGAHSSIS
jgi:hypothetical protein